MLNDITFDGVKFASIEGRGYGLVAERDLGGEEEDAECVKLLTIPGSLVLSAEGVKEYARENKDFRQLLEVAGHQSTREDILLFLLAQLVLSSPDYAGGHGGVMPWTQYFSLLPTHVPTPTMWTKPELSLLTGTSLESAVSAKRSILTKEFELVQNKVADVPYWDELLSINEVVTVEDWVLLDALFRSRSLGLPSSGESMVPCLDLVNHSNRATAYFEENDGQVQLLLRKGCKIPSGTEITITYGEDKPPSEMLFSYGFIDSDSPVQGVVLPVEPFDDDPLAKAKTHIFKASRILKVRRDESGIPRWKSPFLWLACLNQEDGLDFRIVQQTDGSAHMVMPGDMEDLIATHPLKQVFHLRAVTVIFDMFQSQLEKLLSVDDHEEDEEPTLVSEEISQAASRLRTLEEALLRDSLEVLDKERTHLLADDSVLAYLGSMEVPQNEESDAEASNQDEDFS
ncbi:SET domain-containing protein [Xylariomycetidae sp. FL2044]|nr:SET domain-containing protein [Xylariomycetidae sp. FL2044]